MRFGRAEWENCTRRAESLDKSRPEISVDDLGRYGNVQAALADVTRRPWPKPWPGLTFPHQ